MLTVLLRPSKLPQAVRLFSTSLFELPHYDITRTLSSDVSSSITWTFKSAAIIERLPMIMPDQPKWSIDFEEMQNQLNFHRYIREPSNRQEHNNEDSSIAPTPLKIEDVLVEDGNNIKLHLSPRETEDDANDLRTSLNRCLKERLYLIVKKKNRTEFAWRFPTSERQEGVKMRDMALSAAKDAVGKKMDLNPIGFGPMGHMSYLHNDNSGSKVFFYKSQHYQKRKMNLNVKEYEEFKWVTRTQLGEYLTPAHFEYLQCILPLA